MVGIWRRCLLGLGVGLGVGLGLGSGLRSELRLGVGVVLRPGLKLRDAVRRGHARIETPSIL